MSKKPKPRPRKGARKGPTRRPSDALAPKQARFVEEYPKDLNATLAAGRSGYSPRTAASQGARLLKNAKVKAAIDGALAARAVRVGFTADEVLRELGHLCRSDVRYFEVDDNGQLTLTEGAPDEAWRAVASVKHTRKTLPAPEGQEPVVIRTVELRLWDKNSALERAMRHLGIAGVSRHELTGKDGAPLPPAQITIEWEGPKGAGNRRP